MRDKPLLLLPASRLKTLCIIVVASILVATLWPFNFFLKNEVSWLPDTNGVRFGRAGVILSEAPLMVSDVDFSNSWSIELLLRPERFTGLHTIVSFFIPNSLNSFKIKQWGPELYVSHIPAGLPSKARAKFNVVPFLREGRVELLTLSSGRDGTIVYLDGKQVQAFPKFTISQTDLSGQMLLGVSPFDFDPWSGELRGLAIYAKELSPADVFSHYRDWTSDSGSNASEFIDAVAVYMFNERRGNEIRSSTASARSLNIPKRFSVPHKAFLKSPMKEFEATWDYVDDVWRNIAGFMPMGFLLGAFWSITRKPLRAVVYATLAGGLLSFTIEVLQFFIPQRNSGITDIITNTTGASLGALIAISAIGQKILRAKTPPDN